jgi:WD40 repeat protein
LPRPLADPENVVMPVYSVPARIPRLVAFLLALAAGAAIAAPARAASVYTVGADKKIKVWDSTNGDLIKTLDGHEGALTCAAISPDKKLLATGGADKKIKLWNTADGAAVRSIDAHEGAVTCLAFTPDGTKLLSGGSDRKVKSWKVADGSLAATVGSYGGVILNVFAAPGLLIIGVADGKLEIAGEDGSSIASLDTEHSGGLRANASSRAKPVTYSAGAEGKVKYWSETASGEFDGSQGSAVTTMSISADGNRLVTGGADGKVKVWDTGTYKLVTTLDSGMKSALTAVTVSPDGVYIVAGNAEGKAFAFEAATGELVKQTDAHTGAVTAIVYGG